MDVYKNNISKMKAPEAERGETKGRDPNWGELDSERKKIFFDERKMR